MLNDYGSLGTAQKLLSPGNPSSGFVELWECRRLDLTVEFVALNPRWNTLFSPQELNEARTRLRDHGMPASQLPS